MAKKPQILDGKWVKLPVKGILVECCGCGLTHEIDFSLKWKWRRNEKETAVNRNARTIDDFPTRRKRRKKSKTA